MTLTYSGGKKKLPNSAKRLDLLVSNENFSWKDSRDHAIHFYHAILVALPSPSSYSNISLSSKRSYKILGY